MSAENEIFLQGKSILAILLVLCCCLLIYLYKVQSRRNYPPGPWGLPIVGNLPQLGTSPHLTFTRLSRVYGDVFSLRLGSRDVVVLNSATVAREALVQKSRQFSDRPPLFSFTICGVREFSIAFGEYSPIQVQRKKLALRAIHQAVFEKLDRFNESVEREVKTLLRNFLERVELEEPIDPAPLLKTAQVNLAFKLTFGDCGPDSKLKSELQNILDKSANFVENSPATALLDFMPWLKPFLIKEAQKTEDSVQSLMDFVERVSSMDAQNDNEETCIAGCIKRLFSQMKMNHGKMDVEQSVESITTSDDSKPAQTRRQDQIADSKHEKDRVLKVVAADVFGAGLETVSTALQWAILHLILNRDIQRDLHRELDVVVGRQRFPRIQDRSKMPLMQATMMEVLRVSTVLPLALPHRTTDDCTISGYTVPKHTLVIVNLWAMNHDPRYFHSPDKFNPYRFLDGENEFRQELCSFSFPFSAGARRCAGSSLAKAEMFLFLSGLLQKLEFQASDEDSPDMEGVFGLTLRPKPFKVLVRLR